MNEPQQVMCGQIAGELLVRLQNTLPDPAINTLMLMIEGDGVPQAVYRWEVNIEGKRYLYQECVSFREFMDSPGIGMIAARLVGKWTDSIRELHRKSRSDT